MKEKNTVNIFIDETSHLEHDNHYNMCIGSIMVPNEQYVKIREDLKKIQLKYHSPFELKWNKFSNSRLPYYKALVDYFFDSDLSFRCVLVKPKKRLDHNQFNEGSHDNFYYKMIYYLVRKNVKNKDCRIFLDIKDSRSKEKLRKIERIFEHELKNPFPLNSIQHLRSEDNIFIQLTDFLIGAISYKGRVLNENKFKFHKGKREFIEYLEEKSGFSLDDGTPPWEQKFNIFDFQPQKPL